MWGTGCTKVMDAAQLLSVYQILQSRIPKLHLTIFTRHGEVLRKQHPDIHTVPTAKLLEVFLQIKKSDLFIMVGGPFMESATQMFSCAILVTAAKVLGCPIISLGTTVFPYSTWWGNFLFRRIFNQIHAITVRENVSQEILAKLSVKPLVSMYGDPRYVLRPSGKQEVNDILRQEGIHIDRPIIGITLRHLHTQVPEWVKRSHGYTDAHVENAYSVLAKVIDALSHNAQVVVLPMHPKHEEDVMVTQQIKRRMKNPDSLKVLSRSLQVPDLIGIIANCEMIIASRLGSAVFATAMGTPILALAYEARMIDHMSHIGFEDCVVDWRTLDVEFVKKATDTWSSRDAIAKQMKAIAVDHIANAWKYADFVEQFIKMHSKPNNLKKCQSLEEPSGN